MEDCDGVYNLAKAPIKNCLSDFIHLNYSGVPFSSFTWILDLGSWILDLAKGDGRL